MERLEFGEDMKYSALEASIHLNRYALAKPYCKGKKVLDIACGEGYGSYFIRKWGALEIEALDISESAIERARAHYIDEKIHFVCHRDEKLPYSDSAFDMVISLETMEHIKEAEEFLKELKRVLKPDGILIISCPNDRYFQTVGGSGQNPFHEAGYSFKEFKKLLESNFGGNAQYLFGFALNGFTNIPSGFLNETEYKDRNCYDMFQYKKEKNYFQLPTHHALTEDNSSYYVGIWGISDYKLEGNAVFYGREQCIQPIDIDLDTLNDLREWKENIQKEKEMRKAAEENLQKIQYLTECLEEEKKQKESLWKQLEEEKRERQEFYQDLKDKEREEKNKRIAEENKLQQEMDRLSTVLELTNKEKKLVVEKMNENWNSVLEKEKQLAEYKEEVQRIWNSKSFRFMSIFYRMKASFLQIFYKGENK